jgi:hypothetical protein
MEENGLENIEEQGHWNGDKELNRVGYKWLRKNAAKMLKQDLAIASDGIYPPGLSVIALRAPSHRSASSISRNMAVSIEDCSENA